MNVHIKWVASHTVKVTFSEVRYLTKNELVELQQKGAIFDVSVDLEEEAKKFIDHYKEDFSPGKIDLEDDDWYPY